MENLLFFIFVENIPDFLPLTQQKCTLETRNMAMKVGTDHVQIVCNSFQLFDYSTHSCKCKKVTADHLSFLDLLASMAKYHYQQFVVCGRASCKEAVLPVYKSES